MQRIFIILFFSILSFATPSFAQDWSTQGGAARRSEIIRRFKILLERTPTEGMAFKRLISYVGKGKKLNPLIKEYKKKIEKHPKKVNYRLILGHLLKAQNKNKEARVQYEKAVELAPKNALTWLSRGSAYLLLKKMKLASADFEKALSLEKNKDKKQDILRKLADSAFAQRDWEGATKYYDKLVALNPRSEYLRLEYAQILIQYKRFDKALDQYRALLKLAGRDAKTRATTLRDMGDLYEKMGKDKKAIQTYKKAQSLMKKNNWLHRALEQRIVGVYRRSDRLDELLKSYGKKWRNPTYDQAMLLGELYDEIGKEKLALKFYRLAIRKNKRQPDPRVREIRILERSGDDKKVSIAYEKLIRVAPRESRYQFELVKVYFRSGNKKKARSRLTQIERKFKNNIDTYVVLADTYANYDLKKEALRTYKRLVRLEPKNDAFILALGEFYFQEGQTNKAVNVWVKLLKSNLEKGEAYARLGQVLAEHGLVEKGLNYFEKAVKIAPKDNNVRRGLALAYERARRPDNAIATWEYLLKNSDKSLLRNEARTRIINLYYRKNDLRKRMREFALSFEKGDAEAGFFLAAAHIKYVEYEEAEKILKLIQSNASKKEGEDALTTQVMALNSLEKLFTRAGDLKKSIASLESLAALLPLRKREYYQRIAEHSLKLYEDDKAVHYATLAVEANPDDATSQARLGRVYQKMGNLKGAVEQFEKAVDIDPRAFEIQFQLGELLLELERFKDAEKVFKHIVKKASGGSILEQSAKHVINLAELDGRLQEIESEFFPLVYRSPPNPVYRDIMLEIYERETEEYSNTALYGATDKRPEALRNLQKIGTRSLPILIDAIQSRESNQRGRGLRLVRKLRTKSAALSVSKIINDVKDPLRVPAIFTAVAIGDPRTSAALSRAAKDSNPQIRLLAIWALGATGGTVAEKKMIDLIAQKGAYDEQIFALVGLARIATPNARAQLRAYFKSNTGKKGRQVSIWALGRAKDKESIHLLRGELVKKETQTIAAWSLAQIGNKEVRRLLLEHYWSANDHAKKGGKMGLLHLFSKRDQISTHDEMHKEVGFFNPNTGKVDVDRYINALVRQFPSRSRPEKVEKAFPEIKAITLKLAQEKNKSQQLIRDFACVGGFKFGSFLECRSSPKWEQLIREIAPILGKNASWTAPSTYLFFGEIPNMSNLSKIEKAIKSKDIALRRAAIQSVPSAGAKAFPILYKACADPSPEIRRLGALGIARAFLKDNKRTRPTKEQALISLLKDKYPSVRIAAAHTLAILKSKSADQHLIEALKGASRSTTITFVYALHEIGTQKAKGALARYKAHSDLRIRNAANGIY